MGPRTVAVLPADRWLLLWFQQQRRRTSADHHHPRLRASIATLGASVCATGTTVDKSLVSVMRARPSPSACPTVCKGSSAVFSGEPRSQISGLPSLRIAGAQGSAPLKLTVCIHRAAAQPRAVGMAISSRVSFFLAPKTASPDRECLSRVRLPVGRSFATEQATCPFGLDVASRAPPSASVPLAKFKDR